MSILVKGMKMPTSCIYCELNSGERCEATKNYCLYKTRPTHCPLVELPAQHGRLIDALEINEVKWVHPDTAWQSGWNSAIDAILENAQTIIEAEDG